AAPRTPKARRRAALSWSMHARQRLGVSVPGVHAVRLSIDVPYVGMKEALTVSRFEEGRSELWTRGRTCRGTPGAIVAYRPADVHRDVARAGRVTYQLVVLPGVDARVAVSCFAPDDARGAALCRLHDAVAAGADRLALECAIADAIAALDGDDAPRAEPS